MFSGWDRPGGEQPPTPGVSAVAPRAEPGNHPPAKEKRRDARGLLGQAEGISLNHLIVYLLTRVTTVTDLEAQRAKFDELRSRFSEEEAEGALQEMLASRVPAS